MKLRPPFDNGFVCLGVCTVAYPPSAQVRGTTMGRTKARSRKSKAYIMYEYAFVHMTWQIF